MISNLLKHRNAYREGVGGPALHIRIVDKCRTGSRCCVEATSQGAGAGRPTGVGLGSAAEMDARSTNAGSCQDDLIQKDAVMISLLMGGSF